MQILNPKINDIVVKQLGIEPYLQTYQAMHDFTQQRNAKTADQIWLVEHEPTFTQGKTGKQEHILQKTTIPIVQTDRGGQVTYHAPGQQIMYILFDMKRRQLSVRQLVSYLENCVIQTLESYDINAYAKADAPGVYVNNQKISSLGLHIIRGCTLHGLALNVDMDLAPFNFINPCGYAGLQMTQLNAFIKNIDRQQLNQLLIDNFFNQLLNG